MVYWRPHYHQSPTATATLYTKIDGIDSANENIRSLNMFHVFSEIKHVLFKPPFEASAGLCYMAHGVLFLYMLFDKLIS